MLVGLVLGVILQWLYVVSPTIHEKKDNSSYKAIKKPTLIVGWTNRAWVLGSDYFEKQI